MSCYDIRVRPEVLDRIKADHDIKTDSELAERLNVSAPLLSQVRRGIRGAGPAFIAGAAVAFGVPCTGDEDNLYVFVRDDQEAAS